MNPMISFYPLLLLVNAILLTIIAGYITTKKELPGASYFAILLFCVAFWSIAGAHEASVFGAAEKIFSSKISYIGIAFSGMLWFLFSLDFSGVSKKMISILRVFLSIIPLFVLFLVFNNEYFGAVWVQTTAENPLDPYSAVIYSHGWGFYLNMGYQYLFLFLGTVVLLRYAIKSEKRVRNQVLYTVSAVILPWIANVFYVSQAQRFGNYDVTPITFLFAGIFIAIGLFRYKFLNPIPATKNLVYEVLGQGIVIIDQSETIVEVNAIARTLFPADLHLGAVITEYSRDNEYYSILFQALQDKSPLYYSPNTKQWVKIDCVSLASSWRLLVFYDYSYLYGRQEELRKHKNQLERVVNFLADPAYVVSPTGHVVVWNTAMQQLSGVTATSLLGKNIPESLSRFIVTSKKGELLLGKNYFHYEKHRLSSKDLALGDLIYFKDITDLKMAEQQLQERVQTLEDLQFIMKKRELRLQEELKKKGEISKPVAVPWHNT